MGEQETREDDGVGACVLGVGVRWVGRCDF
jgi:hypothetical protein